MDRFQQMQVFQAVAEEQSFAAAARRLSVSPPAVTRAISALEDHLGIKLLNRTTRYVRTTDAGQRYLDDVSRILAEVAVAEEAAAGINAEPRGELVITAPVMFGRQFVLPGILKYLSNYPQMEINALFVDRVVNLMEEGIDVGIRIGALPDSSMRALRVGSVRQVLVASPEYIARRGMPADPSALKEHRLVTSSAAGHRNDWRFYGQNGEQSVRAKPRLTVTSNDAAIDAALCGFGITRVLSYQVADAVAGNRLNTLLTEYEPDPRPIHIVHREGRHGAAKIRTFIDMLAEDLRANEALN